MTASLLASPLGLIGCDLSASGSASAGGSTNAPEPPPKPEYERTFDEFVDVPNQMTEQVKWAAEPIDQAILLAEEIARVRTEFNIDSETFASMATVAFKDGTVEIGAQVEVEAARAEVEALLEKIKATGKELAGVPSRIKVASKEIGKLAMSTPKLLLKSTKELSGELAVAVGDSGAQIEADIQTAKELPSTIKAEASEAKNQLTELPNKAKLATTNLMAAIKGEPFEPMETSGGGEAEAGAEGEAGAGGGTEVAAAGDASAGGAATAGGEAAGSGGQEPGASGAPTTGGTAVIPPPGQQTTSQFPPGAVQVRLDKLQTIGMNTSARGDWLSAADAYEEAFLLAPDNLTFAFKAGDSAARAKDCERARVYLERFVKFADPTMFAPEIAVANKTIGELKTFECPPRTPGDEIALAETMAERAVALGKQEDWGGAATNYALAYQLDPENHKYAFEVAVASWNSRECADAQAYFKHVVSVGDPKKHRVQIREANKYLEEYSASMCPTWAVGEKETLARDLYAQGQALDAALDFKNAIAKYERAYYLLPTNHALAFRIGESSWKAQLCEQAGQNLRTFVSNVDANDPRYNTDLQAAKAIVSKIDSLGCPGALYGTASGGGGGSTTTGGGTTTTTTGGGGEDPGGGGGAGDENPPKSGGGGSSTVACSTTGDSTPAGGIAFGLLVLAVALRRRD